MDHDREAEQREFPHQIRQSLSVDSLQQQENTSRVTADIEAIELTTGVSRAHERTNSENPEQLTQDEQTHSDQGISVDAQVQPISAPRNFGDEQTEPHQVGLEDDPLQQDRVVTDVESQELQQDQPHGNDSTESASESFTKTRKRTRCGRLFRDWILEMVSMFFAIGCLIAMFILLTKYNGQEQPEWPYASTLNLSTLVALMATILRLMLGNVLGAAIGHLKWQWYESSSRPLNHMDTFENASRGSWGSLIFLCSLPRLNLANLGALITILSIVISTFTQQAIETVSCQRSNPGSGKASIPIAQTSLRGVQRTEALGHYPASLNNGLKASIIGGLAGSRSPNSLSPTCLSGNCSFDAPGGFAYTTVGFGSECIDISPLIKQSGLLSWGHGLYDFAEFETKYSLPNGQSLIAQVQGFVVETGLWNTSLSRSRAFELTLGQEHVMGSPKPPKWLLDNVTMTARQRDIALNHSFDGVIFMMPTMSPCSYALKDSDSALGIPPSVNVSSCPQLARSFPHVTSFPANLSVTAAVCYFYPFVQNYNGSVSNGEIVEEPVGDRQPLDVRQPAVRRAGDQDDADEGDFYWTYTFVNPCIIDNVTYTWTSENLTAVPGGITTLGNATGPSQCLYGFNEDWSWGLGIPWSGALGEILSAKPPLSDIDLSETCYLNSTANMMACPQAWWFNDIYNGGNASLSSISAFMKRGFDSFTAQLRSIGTDWDGQPSVATGIVLEMAVCTKFRWEWMIYPFVMVLGTLILLVTVVSSGFKKDMVWKSSVLPFLFYGLEDGEKRIGAEAETEGALTKIARCLHVRLTSEDDGWRLHSTSKHTPVA